MRRRKRGGHAATEPADGDETVLAFAARRFGPAVARDIVAPAVLGIYAGDAAKLSVSAALPRLVDMERAHGSVLRGAIAGRRAGGGAGGACSFPDGLEELPRALAARLGDRRRVARAVAIEPLASGGGGAAGGSGWRVTCSAGDPVEADQVVLAVPGTDAAALIAPLPGSGEAAAALRAVPLAPVAVVCLGFRAPEVGVDLGAYGFLVARGEGVRLLGC